MGWQRCSLTVADKKPANGGWRDYVIIFAAGTAWDAILSIDTIFTANFAAVGAALTTMSVTLLSYAMYDRIIENMKVNWLKVWTLAAGSAVGAGVTTEALKHLLR